MIQDAGVDFSLGKSPGKFDVQIFGLRKILVYELTELREGKVAVCDLIFEIHFTKLGDRVVPKDGGNVNGIIYTKCGSAEHKVICFSSAIKLKLVGQNGHYLTNVPSVTFWNIAITEIQCR